MGEAGVARFVYSARRPSTASPTGCRSPRTRRSSRRASTAAPSALSEDFLRDLARANANWRIAILRYFNPAGAHGRRASAKRTSDAPEQPRALAVPDRRRRGRRARDLRQRLADPGRHRRSATTCTCRTLPRAHVAALRYLARAPGATTLNLGMGRGCSVLEVVAAFERACGRRIDARRSRRGGRATSRATTRTRRGQRRCSGGARRATSTRSAPTRGGGSRRAGY